MNPPNLDPLPLRWIATHICIACIIHIGIAYLPDELTERPLSEPYWNPMGWLMG
jgi:hypothetical protein